MRKNIDEVETGDNSTLIAKESTLVKSFIPTVARSTLLPHEVDWSERWTKIHSQQFTQGVSADVFVPPVDLIVTNNIPLNDFVKRYAFVTYDSIEIRLTTSAPKDVIGAFIAGWFPNPQPMTTKSSITIWELSCRADSVVGSFSAAQDLRWQVPYTFNRELLLAKEFLAGDFTSSEGTLGIPLFSFKTLNSTTYLTSATSKWDLNIFARFHGLKCYFPNSASVALQRRNVVVKQMMSGLTDSITMATDVLGQVSAAGKMGAKAYASYREVIDMAAPVVCSVSGIGCKPQPEKDGPAKPLNQRVQAAGDLNSMVTQPPVMSVPQMISSTPVGDSQTRHSVMDYLSRSQYISTGTSGASAQVVNIYPQMSKTSRVATTTWFKFFAQYANYWCGGMRVTLFVPSHPFIEAKLTTTVSPPAMYPSTNTAHDLVNNATTEHIFTGDQTVIIDFPFITGTDMKRVVRSDFSTAIPPDSNDSSNFTSSLINDFLYSLGTLTISLQVLSATSIHIPVIEYHMFISALPDFAYYGPVTPASVSQLTASEKRVKKQCLIFGEVIEHDETPKKSYNPSTTLIPLESVEQLCSIFSSINDVTSLSRPDSQYDTPFARLDQLANLSRIFLYYRGSMEYKALLNPVFWGSTTITPAIGFYNDPRTWYSALISTSYAIENPAAGNNLGGRNINSFDVCLSKRSIHAWDSIYSESLLAPSVSVEDIYTNVSTTRETDPDVLMRRAGSDFQLAVESLVPDSALWVNGGYPIT